MGIVGNINDQNMQICIDACKECLQACEECLTLWLKEADVQRRVVRDRNFRWSRLFT